MQCPICDDETERCDFCKKDTYCLNCGCQSNICLDIKTKRIANKKSETITFRLSKQILKEVDTFQKKKKFSTRTQAIEELIIIGLDNN
jgi:hypothetical protein